MMKHKFKKWNRQGNEFEKTLREFMKTLYDEFPTFKFFAQGRQSDDVHEAGGSNSQQELTKYYWAPAENGRDGDGTISY